MTASPRFIASPLFRILAVCSLALTVLVGGTAHAGSSTTGYWRVKSGLLYGPDGKRFIAFGDNWHGFDGWWGSNGQVTYRPEGIWAQRAVIDIAKQMVSELGYNTIRVPVSMEMLLNDSLSANADDVISSYNSKYKGLTAQQGLQTFLKDLTDAGLYVIPEVHTTTAGQNAGSWKDYGYSNDQLKAAHLKLVELTKSLGNKVLARGFFNEPYGSSVHGGQVTDPNQTNYRVAANQIAKAILDAEPYSLFALDCVSEMWPTDYNGNYDPNAPHIAQGWGENCYGDARWPVNSAAYRTIVMPHFYFEHNHPMTSPATDGWNELLGAKAPEGSEIGKRCLMLGEWSYAPGAGDQKATLDAFTAYAPNVFRCGAIRWGISPNQYHTEMGLFDQTWTTITEPSKSSLLQMRKAMLGY